MVPPGCSRLTAAGALFQRQISAADEVFVADDGPAALGEHHRVVGSELDEHGGVGLDRDVFDLADLDAGDADEVSALQAGHVGEHGVVGLLRLESQLGEDGEQAQRD